MSYCNISLYLVDPIFTNKIRAAFETFNFTLDFPSGSTFGRLRGCTVNQKFTSTLIINIVIAFVLVWIVIGVASGSTKQQESTTLAFS